MKKSIILVAAAILASSVAMAQFRAQSQDGLTVFEAPKSDVKFDGVKVNVGGAFTQGWQSLNHSNQTIVNSKVIPSLTNTDAAGIGKYDANLLVPMKPGFNNATANLNFDVALAEGVDLKMELYLSARHHQETWVKGGYIQFNKMPFLKCDLVDNIMKYATVKVGHMEVNYGDAHYRRTDNGNSIHNPFIENYIMDAFATEIGAEVDVQANGFVGVLGMTTGQIKGDVSAPTVGAGTNIAGVKDTLTDGSRRPAFIGKFGWDGKVMEDLRVRATVSAYYTAGSTGVTLYGGDRGGSHYYGAMDNTLSGATFTKDNIAFTTGRYNPSYGDKITSMVGNLLLDYKVSNDLSVESFSTFETSKGRGKTEATGERKATQIATDLIVRYGDFYVGARYNKVTSQQYQATDLAAVTPATAGSNGNAFDAVTKGMYDVTIDRTAISAGWFMTKNVLAKVEYVKQNYGGFLYNDIRHNGKFDGLVIEAAIAF
ncbi:MAG: hypothetical protein ACOYOT_12950 [Bacteroidales bacterium]